jgi:hypothetical protein
MWSGAGGLTRYYFMQYTKKQETRATKDQPTEDLMFYAHDAVGMIGR